MHRDAHPLAAVADEEGKLLDERRKLALLRGSHGILVPCDVQVVECDSRPRIQYPVPTSWPSEVMTADLWELIDTGLWGWERGERLSTTALLTRGRRGFSGTHGGANPTGLLNAFLRLAQKRHPEDVLSAVKTFVLQWGPLWLCRTPEHLAHGRQCYWEPQQAMYWGGTAKLCSWRPVEEVYAFVREAQCVKAVVQAAGRLRQGNPVVDEKLWHAMGERPPERSVLTQRQILRHVVENHLARLGQMQTTLLWVDLNASPTLQLISKVGFLPTVWIEIAQILCHAKGVYECSNCGEWYIRKGRQPPKNRNNHCEECRAGNRGAARLHMQRRRASTR